MPKRKATVAGASRKRATHMRDQDIEDLDKREADPVTNAKIAPHGHPAQQPYQMKVASTSLSPALRAKVQHVRASRSDPERKVQLQPSPHHPNHVVVSSTALLGALMTFYADWEVGADPMDLDVAVLRGIVVEGMPGEEGGGSLEEWWKKQGDVVVDLERSGELEVEGDVKRRYLNGGRGKVDGKGVGSLLRFEVEEYCRKVQDEWVEGNWRWYGGEKEERRRGMWEEWGDEVCMSCAVGSGRVFRDMQ